MATYTPLPFDHFKPKYVSLKNDGFYSEKMSLCVSAVALWEYQKVFDDELYFQGCGCHGPGGLITVDFTTLLKDSSGRRLIVIIAGSDSIRAMQCKYGLQAGALKTVVGDYAKGQTTVRLYGGSEEFIIDRTGKVSRWTIDDTTSEEKPEQGDAMTCIESWN